MSFYFKAYYVNLQYRSANLDYKFIFYVNLKLGSNENLAVRGKDFEISSG